MEDHELKVWSQNHNRSKSWSKKKDKCYNCDKKGHYKKDCWSFKQNFNPQKRLASSLDDGSYLFCEAIMSHKARKRFQNV